MEAVGSGRDSKGFKLFQKVAPEITTAHPDGGYRFYLEMVFEDTAEELGVLFDAYLPQAILFPRPNCLDELLRLLNDAEIAPVWAEDETIGWIYQYFTPKELRDAARKESAAPRNSYELAFRNQFYTPRYVVQFLVDNTLGRMWYEMRQGRTRLVDLCQYMVRQPGEVFLAEGQQEPEKPGEGVVPVPFRAKKDPREMRILDPACGSGHFLLYSFEILLTIYEEAYADPQLGPALRKQSTGTPPVPDEEALARFRLVLPKLIVENNLHGIDIDLRATQIAAMALWLRAHRAYCEMGIKVADRPRVTRSNVVCAEPMPGEQDLKEEFIGSLPRKELRDILSALWPKMQLAAEAGTLLRIEKEIQQTVDEARSKWFAEKTEVQPGLFDKGKRPAQKRLVFAAEEERAFWDNAEAEFLSALRQFAARAASGQSYQRWLFADDAARGMAFVDILQNAFDVVLMNPPFGAASRPSKAYIDETYPRTKNDLYAAFVERGLELLLPGGMLGAITSRTGFFLTSFQRWREGILLAEAQLTTLADLGYGVLDAAMVETAAYCLRKLPAPAPTIAVHSDESAGNMGHNEVEMRQ
jgi:hypothetical protein